MYAAASERPQSPPPSKQISLYYAPTEPKEEHILQFAFVHAFEQAHQEQSLMRLFTKFVLVYGPTISHPSLHHALCAYVGHWSGIASDDDQEEYHRRATQSLQRKLNDPPSIEEGDLFAVSLLAMWASCHRMNDRFTAHTRGFTALMNHLRQNTPPMLSTLSVFWPMARDEIILHAYDLELDSEGGIANDLCSNAFTGDEAFQERQEYQHALGRDTLCEVSVDGLFSAAWQQLFVLRACSNKVIQGERKDIVSVIATLAGVRASLYPYDHEQLVTTFLTELTEFDKRNTTNRWPFLDKAAGIVCLLLCKLLLIVLEAPSVSYGIYSKEGIDAANMFVIFINRAEYGLFGRGDSAISGNAVVTTDDTITMFDARLLSGNTPHFVTLTPGWLKGQGQIIFTNCELTKSFETWWEDLIAGVREYLSVMFGGQI